MYQNIYFHRERNIIHVWDDLRGHSSFPYSKYAYQKAVNGEYTSIFGDRLTKIYKWSKDDEGLFESDVNPVTRTLIDMYGNSDDPSKGHTILTYDIEVEMETGTPDVNNATNEITSIAVHDSTSNEYWVLILDKDDKLSNKDTSKAHVLAFRSEGELLLAFYDLYESINPTIVTGWNIDFFDTPYLYSRTVNVLGKQQANRLSPIGLVSYQKRTKRYDVAGVSFLDYLSLYKIYNYTELPNYRLDTVGLKEINKGKIEYDGNLDQLFRDDIDKFIEYNLVDVEIVVELDEKLQFIELCRGICHVGHVAYEDFIYSSKYLEGALLTYLRRRNLVAPNKPNKILMNVREANNGSNRITVDKIPKDLPKVGGIKIRKSESTVVKYEYIDIERDSNTFIINETLSDNLLPGMEMVLDFVGAYVKDPIVGRYEWIYDLDLTSLYPSIIMSLNISPECKIAKIDNWDIGEFINKKVDSYQIGENRISRDKLESLLVSENFSIASNGVIYRQDTVGCIPGILDDWFSKRVEYKNLMKDFGKKGDDEKYAFYHKRQLVQKILLNSLYGVLGLTGWRFYDVQNAEAVTTSGQTVIKSTAQMTNKKYNKELGPIMVLEMEDGSEIKLHTTQHVQVIRNGVHQEIPAIELLETDDFLY